ncbi:ParB/RepB/Spo0J family partition protein [Virgibacillus halodenitrificans]|jgi:ParB family transcriptional regulator, chromosome partitioning protein|uniref:Chromosome partitioning protein ParB n=1 Tax=Virgibacillus halodenitrificans TaxID=1482 RepID=A0AAC9NN05_VIRHA|nr:ParB/RepB/Spo0J family partition protein [Virgibacillus halodenitrificans]APC50126.1 chromosome partitioning protein ParB [Virgibacillus halodenitrificans]MBD1222314.1 ParB/RepB/Spo0J family partition protein [Virgibacillus halodenitrificans]MCG1027562.1 ParB/RepB/Spo0J family partition protein [Virgibacillus halodenitrificans]MEC2157608.1 ParB/RepB/Spo0J family partition protein [Virgibacillus halodenitrificans]MYL44444.1 ParB/RepB/Spo0J family partition protein [Virgibacillus halodenitrif
MAKGLGKGINAFFPDIEEKEDDIIQEIAITECRPNPYQPRKTFHADAIEELKDSILEYGIIQPLIVRKSIKGYEIVVGERRFRAAKEAGLDKIPVVIKELTDDKMMELALLENLQREDLTPIEEAQAYANLMTELKVTQEELAKKLGKSRSHIANIVRLLSLPEQVIAYINNGELSMGHGRALLGLKEKDRIIPFVNKIRHEKLNVRQVEQLINQLNERPVKKKEKPKKDIFLQERESILRERFGTSVNIHRGKRKGKIEIEFYNDEDLERIIETLEK